MIGKVIEGRYAGASVHKLPNKNVLYIQTEDGSKIALSKKNVISIDDVTDQYPSYVRKVMMVMWNDFETSIIQLGAASPATVSRGNSPEKLQPKENTTAVNHKRKKHKAILILALVFVFAFAGVCSSIYFINQKKIRNEKIEKAKIYTYEKVVDVIAGSFDPSSYNTLTESDFSAIIDSIYVTYSEPIIEDNTYTLIATYRVDLFTQYCFFEFEITGNFDSESCNVRFICKYESETSSEINSSNNGSSLSVPEVEIEMPEVVTEEEPQIQNNNTNNSGIVSGSNNSVLLDEKDFYVEFRGLEKGPSDTLIINFYAENKSDVDLYMQLYGECINGYTQGISNNCSLIPAGSKYLALANLQFIIMPEALSAYKIDSITDLEFNLVIGTMQYVIQGDTVLYDVSVHLDIE